MPKRNRVASATLIISDIAPNVKSLCEPGPTFCLAWGLGGDLGLCIPSLPPRLSPSCDRSSCPRSHPCSPACAGDSVTTGRSRQPPQGRSSPPHREPCRWRRLASLHTSFDWITLEHSRASRICQRGREQYTIETTRSSVQFRNVRHFVTPARGLRPGLTASGAIAQAWPAFDIAPSPRATCLMRVPISSSPAPA